MLADFEIGIANIYTLTLYKDYLQNINRWYLSTQQCFGWLTSHPFQMRDTLIKPQYEKVYGLICSHALYSQWRERQEGCYGDAEEPSLVAPRCTNRSLHLYPRPVQDCWGPTNLSHLTRTFMKPYTKASQLPPLLQKSCPIPHFYFFTVLNNM